MKRIGREPSPTDLGYKIIDDEIKNLMALRELADTDEFRAVANILAAKSTYDATPTHGDKSWNFSCYFSGLTSWSDVTLTNIAGDLAKLGPDESSMKEYPNENNNDYIFQWKFEDEYVIEVRLVAYLSANAPGACRRIQIGTKMVEQPIYRNECAPPAELVPDAALPAPVLNLEVL